MFIVNYLEVLVGLDLNFVMILFKLNFNMFFVIKKE